MSTLLLPINPWTRLFEETDPKLTKFWSIQELKQLAKKDMTLAQLFSKKVGQDLLKHFTKGFSIMDLIQYDKSIAGEQPSSGATNVTQLKLKTDVVYGASVWKGVQIAFKDKVNHVFQLNWKTFDRENSTLMNYVKGSNHPTSRKDLTLAWCRYTIFPKSSDNPESYVVLDEIQTDLDDAQFLGPDFMKGWEVKTMRAFIDFVRHKLKVRKIYMPTYDTKLDLYSAHPPMYLYKELPNKFGFKKQSDKEGFMILENLKSEPVESKRFSEALESSPFMEALTEYFKIFKGK